MIKEIITMLSMSTPAVPNYFHDLNLMQQKAINALEGPVLVLAGAGTGKTKVLTTRLAHLLYEKKVWPSEVLAVTFTNKAAQEMRNRVNALLGIAADGAWIGTFHGLCARILRRHAETIDLSTDFTILDTDDQIRLIKQLLKAENIDPKKVPPRMVIAIINRWKDRALTPDQVPESENSRWGACSLLHLYRTYQMRLKTLNAVDFGDLLLHTLIVFKQNPEILSKYQHQFKYILVDEYQDTNVAQHTWLKLLTQGHGNICCVGDDDQSIYGWRGAEIKNILSFQKDFPGATVIRLEQNYRSTGHILKAASHLIAHNQGRLGKTLWTKGDLGEKVRIQGLFDGAEEARYVVDVIEAQQRDGKNLGNMAILVRAGFQTREFEERLIALGVPYRVIGGPRFYERLEIRDALAYLRWIQNFDDSLAFERIVNTPRRGIGNTTLQKIHDIARQNNLSLARATEQLLQTKEFSLRIKLSFTTLFTQRQQWEQLIDREKPGDLARIVLDESGYTAMWQQDKTPDAKTRLENLKELAAAMEQFDTLSSFLEHVSLVTETHNDENLEKLTLMTVHASKGLEFETIFLTGWEENLFPHPRTLEELGSEGLEEERRLAYVGLTRAKTRAIITYAAHRRHYKGWQSAIPSRFLRELPNDHIIQLR